MRRAALLLAIPALIAAAPDGSPLAHHGMPGRAIPCAACRGADFRGQAATGAPDIAGLPVPTTLAAIASGKLGDNYAMRSTAKEPTPDEARSVAADLAVLSKGSA